MGSLVRAFSAFNARDQMDAMRRKAMGQTFSWSASALAYEKLYKSAVAA